MFEVGEKVICVDATIKVELLFSVIRDFKIWVVQENTYTIREILTNNDIVVGILLEEVHNPPIMIPLLKRIQEPAFATWRFRKRTFQEIEAEQEIEREEYVLGPSIANDIRKIGEILERGA